MADTYRYLWLGRTNIKELGVYGGWTLFVITVKIG